VELVFIFHPSLSGLKRIWAPRSWTQCTPKVRFQDFLTAILAEFLVGRKLVAYGNATNLIATAFYVVLTLLFYGMFKPVNRSLSLLAALFSLGGRQAEGERAGCDCQRTPFIQVGDQVDIGTMHLRDCTSRAIHNGTEIQQKVNLAMLQAKESGIDSSVVSNSSTSSKSSEVSLKAKPFFCSAATCWMAFW
jgi:hypothetical protein